ILLGRLQPERPFPGLTLARTSTMTKRSIVAAALGVALLAPAAASAETLQNPTRQQLQTLKQQQRAAKNKAGAAATGRKAPKKRAAKRALKKVLKLRKIRRTGGRG